MNKKEWEEVKRYYNKHYKGELSKTIFGLLIVGGFYGWLFLEILEKLQ